jgi:hypothetical protein
VREFHDMIAGLSQQNWEAAQAGVMASEWATKEPDRARRVANMLRYGAWPTT